MAKNQVTGQVKHTIAKPIPPPTQLIREGVNPNANRSATNEKQDVKK